MRPKLILPNFAPRHSRDEINSGLRRETSVISSFAENELVRSPRAEARLLGLGARETSGWRCVESLGTIRQTILHFTTMEPKIYLLDYGAGNVRSLVNAINKIGFNLQVIESVADFDKADVPVQ